MDLTLNRFHTAHDRHYSMALEEIRSGRKRSHWMWYIFPQLQDLGRSTTALYYGIQGRQEAIAYWNDPVLSGHLVEISRALLQLHDPIGLILGYPDNMKLQSCMTLFWLVSRNPVFQEVLNRFYDGCMDMITVKILEDG